MPRTARVALMQIVIGLNNKYPKSDIEFNAEDQGGKVAGHYGYYLYQCSKPRCDPVLRLSLQSASSDRLFRL